MPSDANDVELSSVRCTARTKKLAKVYAAQAGTTITALVERALLEYLERHPVETPSSAMRS